MNKELFEKTKEIIESIHVDKWMWDNAGNGVGVHKDRSNAFEIFLNKENGCLEITKWMDLTRSQRRWVKKFAREIFEEVAVRKLQRRFDVA